MIPKLIKPNAKISLKMAESSETKSEVLFENISIFIFDAKLIVALLSLLRTATFSETKVDI